MDKAERKNELLSSHQKGRAHHIQLQKFKTDISYRNWSTPNHLSKSIYACGLSFPGAKSTQFVYLHPHRIPYTLEKKGWNDRKENQKDHLGIHDILTFISVNTTKESVLKPKQKQSYKPENYR